MGKNCLLLGLSRQEIIFEQPAKWYSLFLNRNKVGIEGNKARVNLLETFGKDKTGHPPSLEFKSDWSVSEDDHWADHLANDPGICSVWEALNFATKQLPGIRAREKKHLSQTESWWEWSYINMNRMGEDT